MSDGKFFPKADPRLFPRVHARADALVRHTTYTDPGMCIEEALETAWADAWHLVDEYSRDGDHESAVAWLAVARELTDRQDTHQAVMPV